MGYPKIFICLLFCCSAVTGLYFHIKETDKKCFIEEIPNQTMVIGKYKIQEFDEGHQDFYDQPAWGFGMKVEVTDPYQKTVLSRMYAAEGQFTFTSHTDGEHQICLHSNSTAWFGGGQLRVHLDIQIGDHAVDYGDASGKEKVSELELRVRQLLEQAAQIQKEQNYQRYREERFRKTSESTNQRVLYWSLAQTAVLTLTGFWQMRHLKGFFEAKKLV